MSNQTRGGAYESTFEHYRRYEAQPARVREVLRRAPWNLHVGSWTKDLPADPEAARRVLIGKLQERLGREVRDLYGSDHPQAAASPTPVAPEWERKKRRGGRAC